MSQSEYASILKCTPWLAKFLTRRGLKQPDHRPLYEYHATSEEYDELKRLLRAIGVPDGYKSDMGMGANLQDDRYLSIFLENGENYP